MRTRSCLLLLPLVLSWPIDTVASDCAARWITDYGKDQTWTVENPRYLADVNGDGLADIVGFASDGVYVSLSTGSGFTSPNLWVKHFGHSAGGSRVGQHPPHVLDLNKDGCADVLGFGSDGVWVALSTSRYFQNPTKWSSEFGSDAGWVVGQSARMFGDVNGDGYPDIVAMKKNDYELRVSLGGPKGFSKSQTWMDSPIPLPPADCNDDGRSDIGVFQDDGVICAESVIVAGKPNLRPSVWQTLQGQPRRAGALSVHGHGDRLVVQGCPLPRRLGLADRFRRRQRPSPAERLYAVGDAERDRSDPRGNRTSDLTLTTDHLAAPPVRSGAGGRAGFKPTSSP